MHMSHSTRRAVSRASTTPSNAPPFVTLPAPTPEPPPQPDARLLRQACGVVTIHQKRTFLDKLAQQPQKTLTRLVVPDTSSSQASGVWSATWGSLCVVRGLSLRIIKADTEGRLFTDSTGRGDPVKQMVFWEPAPGQPHRALVHAASIAGHHPADMTLAVQADMARQGFQEAEVRVSADQPELAERFHHTPGWQAIALEGGDLLFRRSLNAALPED